VACAQSPTHLYVVGNAPLSVFVHLGFALSGWARPLTLLNARRATGQWDVLHLDGPKPGPAFFSRVSGLAAPQEAEGRLDLYISCFGDAAPAAVTQRRAGGPRAWLVTLSTQADQLLDADNVGRVAAELAHHLMRVTTCWPQSQGRGLFLRGPAPLAFLVGRAMNPRLHGPLTLFEYGAATYTPVLTLPLAADSAVAPVVITSSTNNSLLLKRTVVFLSEKRRLLFCPLSIRPF
jgi:hypothetical protein